MMSLKSGKIQALKNLDTIQSRKRNKQLYYRNINTFDIEVTNYIESDYNRVGIVYLWNYCIDENTIYYGRTLEEFKEFLNDYADKLEKNNNNCIQVIYVHNLAYEFQFLRYYFNWQEVFLINARRPLNLKYRCFEFRCSYLLTNMNLKNFFKNYNVETEKLNYDYKKKRYPWTELTQEELQYCYNDTLGLYQAINKLLELDKRNVTDVPPTSTAYVRQDVKRAQSITVKRTIERLSNIDEDIYKALKSAFVGGNTHSNRFYTNKIIENVTCYDITSSYPFAQLTALYPIEPFREKHKLDNFKFDSKFAYLVLCEFTDIKLKDYFDGMPNISTSKCLEKANYTLDNGRILEAGKILIWLTDIEYHIIENHYHWKNVEIKKCYYSRYGLLPDCIKSVIYKYFEGKCTLKNTDYYLYMKSKNKLNSIYGMSAFDIGKKRFKYEDNDYKKDTRTESEILEDVLSNGTQAEPYQWGVWTTARARENLDKLIRLAGDRFIYCDTDSVYIYGELDKEIEELNKEIIKKSEEYKVDFNGQSYYMGVWNKDKDCKRFITLGAKKYCYEDSNGVHTVTAGVSKSAGVEKVEDYKIGHIFKNATNSAWYTDEEITVKINDRNLTIPSCLYIEENDYTLGVTDNYNALLYYISDGTSDLMFYE